MVMFLFLDGVFGDGFADEGQEVVTLLSVLGEFCFVRIVVLDVLFLVGLGKEVGVIFLLIIF